MNITVHRFVSDHDTTLSTVSVDGAFVAFGLEDEYRYHKVAGETRIPAGDYRIGLRRVGGFHARYSQKFGSFHRGMLEVEGVPNFKYVLIHVGNSEKQTAGCLLVGMGATADPGNMSIASSVRAYKRLYATVIDEAVRGNLYIEYIDADQLTAPLLA